MSNTNWIQRILNRLGAPAGASVSVDIAALKTIIDSIPTTMVGTDNAALASVLGALDTAAATGAVSNAKEGMAYLKQLVTKLLNVTDGLGALKTLIEAIPTTMVGTDGAALAADWTSALATALGNYTAARAGYLDELAAANLPADVGNLLTRLSATRAGYLDELDFDLAAAIAAIPTTMVGTNGAALATNYTATRAGYLDNIAATAKGREQIAVTTIDLNQAAGTYDLFTGTAQVVILESLNIKMPTGAAGGSLTSISIQTDDATPGVIINPTDGAVANLTSEADLAWTGSLYITVATKIRLTIAGGAHGTAYVCKVTAKCRAVVAGGSLA